MRSQDETHYLGDGCVPPHMVGSEPPVGLEPLTMDDLVEMAKRIELPPVGPVTRERERQQIDAERAVYDQLIGPGLSASDPSVQDYDLTDHLELFMADESIVKITVEVTLP